MLSFEIPKTRQSILVNSGNSFEKLMASLVQPGVLSFG